MVNYASDVEAVKALQEKYNELRQAVGQVIIGQMDVVEKLVISILCNGHSLLVGCSGTGQNIAGKNGSRCP
jgi:MoxR-like ATPase